MKRILGAVSPMVVAACTTTPEAGDSGFRCRAEPIADLVGRPATQELGAEALRRSGSHSLRWIRPGDAVTMDYRPDRLNVTLDGRGNVEGFGCG